MIYAIDPGNTRSAFVLFDPKKQRIESMGLEDNDSLVRQLTMLPKRISVFAIERVASFGFCVGREIFETCEWVGRFWQAVATQNVRIYPVYRKQVVVHHTAKATAGDSLVRAEMISRFGKENLKGCKYDIWSALAISSFVGDKLAAEVTDT